MGGLWEEEVELGTSELLLARWRDDEGESTILRGIWLFAVVDSPYIAFGMSSTVISCRIAFPVESFGWRTSSHVGSRATYAFGDLGLSALSSTRDWHGP